MSHKYVLERFKSYFPQYAAEMIEWFPNGNNSVRVRLKFARDYVFTYNGPSDWRFETVNSFVKSM